MRGLNGDLGLVVVEEGVKGRSSMSRDWILEERNGIFGGNGVECWYVKRRWRL